MTSYVLFHYAAVCSPACLHSGTCIAPNTCGCQTEWTGDYCQTPSCPDGCMNGGTCALDRTCLCQPLWTGSSCHIAICHGGCANGGTCGLNHTCVCSPGWTGSNCHEAYCSGGCVHGMCSYPGTCSCQQGACIAPNICNCQPEWTGDHCQTPVCSPGCLNRGTCVAGNTCSCSSEWTGSRCHLDVNECEDDVLNNCQQVCHNTPGSYNCSCNPGYTLDSNHHTCRNLCPGGCLNGGTCASNHTCICTPGWTGTNCQTDCNECEDDCASSNNCQQICHNNVGSYTCTCNEGFTLNSDGYTCSASCPGGCSNGGTCALNHTCLCQPLWTGSNCHIATCPGGCANGGTCGLNHICLCPPGWTGSNCHEDVNECASPLTNSCQQLCFNTPGSYSCGCYSGYTLNSNSFTCD